MGEGRVGLAGDSHLARQVGYRDGGCLRFYVHIANVRLRFAHRIYDLLRLVS